MILKVRDDHAGVPREICYRLHSDFGPEFLNVGMTNLCMELGTTQTRTQGYDPNANGAGEQAIGLLKS